MKVIEQLVAQALKEMKAEEPAAFVKPKEETYGVFATMDEAIEASAKAQKTLLFSKIEDRQRYVDIIRATILRRENLELISRMAVEETAIGKYEHKLIKNRLAAEKTPGTEDLVTEAQTGDHGLTLVEYCPFGVIGAITPKPDRDHHLQLNLYDRGRKHRCIQPTSKSKEGFPASR